MTDNKKKVDSGYTFFYGLVSAGLLGSGLVAAYMGFIHDDMVGVLAGVGMLITSGLYAIASRLVLYPINEVKDQSKG